MRAAVLMVGGLILVSCAAGSTATLVSSTTVPPAPTTTVSATTTVPTTTVVATTSTTSTTTTTPVLVVEGVPAEALALIGAPMPDVDLTMDSPGDFERWFREYERWNAWFITNGSSDPDLIGSVLVAGGDVYLDALESVEKANEAGVLGLVSGELEIDRFDGASTFFDQGFLEVVLWSRSSGTLWLLDSETLEVLDTSEAASGREFGVSVLNLERSAAGDWLLRSWTQP